MSIEVPTSLADACLISFVVQILESDPQVQTSDIIMESDNAQPRFQTGSQHLSYVGRPANLP